MSKEIFDQDEGNAGLEKVHCLCMSHGMGTDSHACQEWAWRVWPGASTSAECIERRAGPAFHLEIRLNVDFGGLHIGIDMSNKIFDHDEGNAGLEKVHCLCMSHGMGTDSHACQSGHGGCGPL